MCEGPSRISGPIPPDPGLFPEYYKRPLSGEALMLGTGFTLCFGVTQLDVLIPWCPRQSLFTLLKVLLVVTLKYFVQLVERWESIRQR